MMDSRLLILLRRVGRRNQWTAALCTAAMVGGCWLTLVVAVLLLDAALAWSISALVVVDGLLLLAAGLGAVYVGWVTHQHRFQPRRLARELECRLHLTDNPLINAVDLLVTPPPSSSPELVERTIEQGRALAASLAPGVLVDHRRFRTTIVAMVIGGVLFTFGCLAAHNFWMTMLIRYLQPTADHPPYTSLRFDLNMSPQPLRPGQPTMLTVSISGRVLPRQANLVLEEGSQRRVVPLWPKDHGRFSLSFDRVPSSSRFFVDTAQGRSQWFELNVMSLSSVTGEAADRGASSEKAQSSPLKAQADPARSATDPREGGQGESQSGMFGRPGEAVTEQLSVSHSVEILKPSADSDPMTHNTAGLQGVPAAYRGVVQAYFQRLAEDSR